MKSELHPSARKVQDAVRALGFPCQVRELPDSTRTSREAAQAVGCQVGQIAKSLIFKGVRTGRALLAIASGSNRVDETRLSQLAGEPIAKASADFVREKTGFAIGGVPPLGHVRQLSTWIDEDLLSYPVVWAAAGTPHAVFPLDPTHLPSMTGGEVSQIGLRE